MNKAAWIARRSIVGQGVQNRPPTPYDDIQSAERIRDRSSDVNTPDPGLLRRLPLRVVKAQAASSLPAFQPAAGGKVEKPRSPARRKKWLNTAPETSSLLTVNGSVECQWIEYTGPDGFRDAVAVKKPCTGFKRNDEKTLGGGSSSKLNNQACKVCGAEDRKVCCAAVAAWEVKFQKMINSGCEGWGGMEMPENERAPPPDEGAPPPISITVSHDSALNLGRKGRRRLSGTLPSSSVWEVIKGAVLSQSAEGERGERGARGGRGERGVGHWSVSPYAPKKSHSL